MIVRAFTDESRRGYRLASIALVAVTATLSVALVHFGAAPIKGPWDMHVLLDGGWRILNGQTPNVDYYNPIGPLTYALIALGMKLWHPSTSAVAYGNVLFAVVLVTYAWAIGQPRLSALSAAVFALFVFVLVTAPRPLGYPVFKTTYAMIYNRQGYALLSILLLELFIKVRDQVRPHYLLDGASSGILLALILLCKISYFGMAAVAAAIHLALFSHRKKWIIGVAGGFLVSVAAVELLLGTTLISYFSDINVAAHVQSSSQRLRLLIAGGKNNLINIYLVFLLLIFARFSAVDEGSRNGVTIKMWAIIAFVVGFGLTIGAGNAAQGGGAQDPLFFVGGLIILEYLSRECHRCEHRSKGTNALPTLLAILVVFPVFCGSIMIRDCVSMAYAAAWNQFKLPAFEESRRFHSKTLYDFVIPESTDHITAYWPAREHTDKINDGLDLLRKYATNSDKVVSLSFTNPFSFGLELIPPKGDVLWWDLNFSFDRKHTPAAEKIFKEATIVMIAVLKDRRQGSDFEEVDLMVDLYGDYVKKYFVEKDHSRVWSLWVRR
jgi:hypothetical protein